MLVERHPSALGEIIIAVHGGAVSGLWFAGQKYELRGVDESLPEQAGDREALCRCKKWLDEYFSGRTPKIDFALDPAGTDFQKKVWRELMNIPFGKTASYGDIARNIGCKSARAVGAAVGKNPLSILIPCHRVLGADASLTGYAGGLERKKFLLALENTTFNT